MQDLSILSDPVPSKAKWKIPFGVSLFFKTVSCSAVSVFTLWAFGALHFDFPIGKTIAAWVFLISVMLMLLLTKGFWKKIASTLTACGIVLAWWLTLEPRNDRNWQPDVAELAWAEVKGDEVTLHNVRNCDYQTETEFTVRQETRTVRLSQITGVDLFIVYWGSPFMAHPIASFQLADAPPICFSIETRKEVGETYSAIGGLYRRFELAYVAADERDAIRLRTNYRKGEDTYLYRTKVTPERARERFMEYVNTINKLREEPRWYNAVTTNCTTTIRSQHPASQRLPWDWRMLVNGKGDEMLFERNAFVTDGLSFAELRPKALINSAAQAADKSPDFSRLIRVNRPGFASLPVSGSNP
jgi:hypothetical protein